MNNDVININEYESIREPNTSQISNLLQEHANRYVKYIIVLVLLIFTIILIFVIVYYYLTKKQEMNSNSDNIIYSSMPYNNII
jgi:predicted PurR-regulated permease PerM